jgi:hypothetical protein
VLTLLRRLGILPGRAWDASSVHSAPEVEVYGRIVVERNAGTRLTAVALGGGKR